MKKILLATCLSLGIAAGANANSCTYINLTGCTYDISTQGGLTSIPPGNTTFASPANVTNPSAPPSGTFTGTKITMAGTALGIYIGTGGPLTDSTGNYGVYPPCNGGNSATTTWNVGGAPNYDIVVLIF